MKLWIRSQYRETLRLAEMLDIYELEAGEEKRFVIEESGVDIGCYKSKERALEVLDEIQKLMIEYYQSIDYKIVPIYEMPKE